MSVIHIEIPDDLSHQLEPYKDNLDNLLRMGLREIKMSQGLAFYKDGHCSLWKAARMSGVSLREMIRYANSQGIYAPFDEKSVNEELQ